MDDAEREARDRVDLWTTGLDSLLIFVSYAPTIAFKSNLTPIPRLVCSLALFHPSSLTLEAILWKTLSRIYSVTYETP